MNDKRFLFGILAVIALLLLAVPASATISVNVASVGMTYITWSWPAGLPVTNESVDGILVYTFDPSLNTFTLSELPTNESHTFCVYTPVSSGCSVASTLPDTSVYYTLTQIAYQWAYLILIIGLIWVGMQKKMGFALLFASGVSLYALWIHVNSTATQTTDISNLTFYLYIFLFVFPFVLIYFKGGWLK